MEPVFRVFADTDTVFLKNTLFRRYPPTLDFLPFDYLIVANREFDSSSLSETFSFFSELGIRKFIILLEFDRTRHTVTQIKERQKLLEQVIRSVRPRGLTVRSALSLVLSEDIVYDPTLVQIFRSSPFLFLNLPLFCDESWVDGNLNYLLFKQKISPILTSFEGNIFTNSSSRIDQMMRSKAYHISLDLNYLTALDSDIRLMQIISREIPTMPCISHGLSNYVGALHAFDDLRERLGTGTYTRFSRNLFKTEKELFPQIHYYTK